MNKDTGSSGYINKKGRRRSPKDRLWLALTVLLSAVFVFCAATYLLTPLFMVHPVRDEAAEDAISLYEEIIPVSVPFDASDDMGSSKDAILSGYLLDRAGTDELIIYFGGISDCASFIMQRFHDDLPYEDSFISEYDIAVIDWPGYGRSGGSANDISLREAAVSIVSYFKDLPERSAGQLSDEGPKVVIMAYSMGCGPATYAASECGCDRLILLSPYASSDDLYNSVTDIFHGPLKSLLSYHMDTADYAAGVSARTLIVASRSDRRVPFESSERLRSAFGDCSFAVFDDISHGGIPEDPAVLDAAGSFLSE